MISGFGRINTGSFNTDFVPRSGQVVARFVLLVKLLFAIAALAMGAAVLPAPGQIRFEEIAQKAGLKFELHNGAGGRLHQIELMPAGVAAFDFDNDGCTDIFFVNGAAIPCLTRPARSSTIACFETTAISRSPT